MIKFHIFPKSISIILTVGTFAGLLTATPHKMAAQSPDNPKLVQPIAPLPVTIPLAGTWQFVPDPMQPANSSLSLRPANSSVPALERRNWQDIAVPSNWFLQGQDLDGVVWYRHRFPVDSSLKDKVVKLVFEGVDYAADVWLNGEYLGFHEGYFQPFSFLVSEQLRLGGENVLTVRVNSPKERGGKDWSLHKRLIKGIFSHHDTRPGGAWSDRGQEQNTGGIWAPVYLQVSETIAIDRVKITPHLYLKDQKAIAEVDLTLTYPGQTPEDVQVQLQLAPHNFPGVPDELIVEQRRLEPGVNHLKFHLVREKPRLWWTWEHGPPNLYKLKVSIVESGRTLDRSETVFGFRTITFDPIAQVWKLNGKRLFLRGTNYIASQWLSEMTPEKYGFDLALMKQANINAVRVHAHIEAQSFYRLCDRAGMLVWQDFPLQWGYTDKPELIAEAIKQGKDMINLLYNHPSLIAWSLHNEPPWNADWMQYKYENYDPEQNQKLDEELFASLRNLDRTRYLQKHSSISEHPWWGWYYGPFQKYAEPTEEPIITEFGAQALPNLPSLRRIFTEAELWPDTEAEWEKWSYHNFQRHETFNIAQVPMGTNPKEFIDNTQRYQAQLTQFAAEAYRRQRFQPVSGIFQFMFVENWPSVNWGIVDYWRNPKPGYEALKIAYQPVLPSIVWSKQIWQLGEEIHLGLWVINDLWRAFPEAKVTYTLQHQWQKVQTVQVTTDIEPDSLQDLMTISYQPKQVGDYELVVRILDRDGNLLGQNAFEFTVATTEQDAPS